MLFFSCARVFCMFFVSTDMLLLLFFYIRLPLNSRGEWKRLVTNAKEAECERTGEVRERDRTRAKLKLFEKASQRVKL